MRLPEPDRRALHPAPVRAVICQVRFDAEPEEKRREVGRRWAEALRDQLPRFEQLQGELITIQNGPGGAPSVQQRAETGWRFSDPDRQLSATLVGHALALESNDYPGWGPFVELYRQLLALLVETVDPVIEERLGLRYINELSAEHLDPAALGFGSHAALGSGVTQLEQRAVVDVDGELHAGLRAARNQQQQLAELDIDVYCEGGRPFDTDVVIAALPKLNTAALQLFEACVDDDYLATARGKSESKGAAT